MLGLDVPGAWRVERGRPEVVVAVIDNGFDVAHPDLRAQLWTNPAEVAGDGLDNDGNGYVDDLHGWNFLARSARVSLDEPAGVAPALWSHGTAAAGIVAASTDNGLGVASCCPGCRWMPLVARDFRIARTVLPRLPEALAYAVRNGARVVSISDGVPAGALAPDEVTALEGAVRAATAAGVLVVASAGNDGAAAVRWPARIPEVLAVAAVDRDGAPAAFTSYGPEVDVAAPGVEVFTTEGGGGYFDFAGTSASAPIVAGLAGLLFSAHPAWTPAQVAARIRATAGPADTSDRPALAGQLGAGVVHFGRALASP